ncbi:P-loop containing nucleoside triphosphate hydrolase protein [Ochromonadaceae sp. CCMP2298]|nr:P-loop containing nucleoside triphosphate hydrolase protein [Ochromonadaceae sp. CCMP2298]
MKPADATSAKPTFLTKKQREELALQRLESKRDEQETKMKDVQTAHQNFITGKTLDDRRREERLARDREEEDRKRREREESKEAKEHDHEVIAIRQHYLGGAEKKRRITKPSDKFAKVFQFDWEATDDTAKDDVNPLYNNRMKINALYGRGYIAGVDQKEQRKDSSFLLTLSEKRMQEASNMERESDLTEGQKRDRLKQRERATADFKQRRKHELQEIDEQVENKMGRHWSDKKLADMAERDWRIFREDFDIRIQGGRATLPLRYWAEAKFPDAVMKAIEDAGYKEPSPIQRQAIPVGMSHRDIMGIAETGSGKTCAFVVPLICYLLDLPKIYLERVQEQGPLAVIMAPTRELALQIEEECKKLLRHTDFRTVSVVGGQSIEEQGFKLRKGIEIVIGTPGRMIDCIENNYLVLNQCNYVVLDEADRMIDMGFEPQVVAVLEAMGGLLKSADEDQAELQLKQIEEKEADGERQIYRVTAMFSATMSPQVEAIARNYLRHPVLIRIGDEDSGKNKRIEQRVVFVAEAQKKSRVSDDLRRMSSQDKIIVFVNSKKQGDSLGRHLETAHFSTGVLHGGRSQDQREETLEQFRNGEVQILVATDVAARGLDIPDVSHIINYDCPQKIAPYCHRIGRTGRAGKSGVATTYLTEGDTDIMYDLKSYLESTDTPVPSQLAHHAAAQAPVGSRDDKGKLMGQKKDAIQFLRD